MVDDKKVDDEQGKEVDEEGNEKPSGEPSPEEVKQLAKDKKLAAEAAKYRIQLRDAEKALEESRRVADEFKKKIEEGSATNQSASAELAETKRIVRELTEKDKARAAKELATEAKLRSQSIRSAIATAVGNAKLLEPSSATELLLPKADIAADETVVFNVKDEAGETIPVEATAENILKYKLIPSIYIPASGVPGSGGPKGGLNKADSKKLDAGVDMERAKTDNEYYSKNKDAITRERQRLKTLPA